MRYAEILSFVVPARDKQSVKRDCELEGDGHITESTNNIIYLNCVYSN